MNRLSRDAMSSMSFPFCFSSSASACNKEGRVASPVFFFALWALLAALPVSAWGFSFGDIDIKSNFGERFNAELDLVLEGEGKVDVQIGGEEDYRRLELSRPRIIDNLVIEKSVQLQGGRKVVRVVSKRPLFYPSFNLVLRGTHDGGTVIENYLVTVDFRQSLALNVKGRKKNQPVAPSSEPVDLLQGGETGSDSLAAASSKKKEADPEAADGPASGGTKDGAPASPPVAVAATQAKPPSPLMGKRTPDNPIRSARWARKRIAPEPEPLDADEVPPPEEPPVQVAENVQIEPPAKEETPPETEVAQAVEEEGVVSTTGGNAALVGGLGAPEYGPLERGENLFAISRKLGVERGDANRFVVAVWLDNPDSFVFGNMNGLRQGTRLNLEKLEQRLAEVDAEDARNLLQSQWQEWKVIRQRFSTPLGADGQEDTTSQENRLPSENARDKLQIFEMLKDWKQTWESGDLDGHMARFSDRALQASAGGGIRALKRRMFKRHENARLRAHRAILVLKAGRPMISFDQSFSSKKMESFGRKDIEIAWEDSEWKIVNEKFRVKEHQEKSDFAPFVQMSATPASPSAPEQAGPQSIFSKERPIASPLVIHASSHMDFHMATQAINALRNKGFNAYSTPVHISRKRKIFRVYVGRFFDEDQAKALARELKRLPIARFAVAVRYPYTLMAGNYDAEEQAQDKIDALRSLGLSPFLFTTSDADFSNTRFRVLLGAFAKEKDAARLSRDLEANQIEFSLITP